MIVFSTKTKTKTKQNDMIVPIIFFCTCRLLITLATKSQKNKIKLCGDNTTCTCMERYYKFCYIYLQICATNYLKKKIRYYLSMIMLKFGFV